MPRRAVAPRRSSERASARRTAEYAPPTADQKDSSALRARAAHPSGQAVREQAHVDPYPGAKEPAARALREGGGALRSRILETTGCRRRVRSSSYDLVLTRRSRAAPPAAQPQIPYEYYALPYCHPSFIHCKIVLKQLGANKHFGSAMKERCQGSAYNGGIFCNRVDNLDGDHYMRDDCAHEGYAQCHNCDTADECDATGISKTVVVTHESKYALMAKQNEYKCAMDTQGDCQCACRHHIPCCTKEGFMLENPTLPGNVYTTVQDLQSCCDMCTNHPMCISFEYDSDGVCSLKSGKPRFTPQTRFVSASGSARQIWAGVRSGMQCLAEESCNCPAEDLAPSLYFKDPKEYSP